MEDKINIYLTYETATTLESDMSLFGFIKPNGLINRNDFINTLLNNYLEIYSNNHKLIENKILDSINKHIPNINKIQKEKVVLDIVEHISQTIIQESGFVSTLSFKPTKKLSNSARYILDNVSNLSGYLRGMIESYSKLPQNKREQIMFIDIYDEVFSSINEHKTLKVKHKRNTEIKEISPYMIATGKEEMFNYVLAQDDKGNPISFRLGNLIYAYKLDKTSSFNELSLERFKDAKKYGPQFISSDIINACIELTDEGIRHFNRAYVHRPNPTKIEGHLYYFDWNYDQIFYYFTRLGKDAKIIYPESLKQDMITFLKESLENYQ